MDKRTNDVSDKILYPGRTVKDCTIERRDKVVEAWLSWVLHNETPLGTCPAFADTCGRATPLNSFVALACSSYHMSLNVEATTQRMYIGAARVPPKDPIPTRHLPILVHSHTTSPNHGQAPASQKDRRPIRYKATCLDCCQAGRDTIQRSSDSLYDGGRAGPSACLFSGQSVARKSRKGAARTAHWKVRALASLPLGTHLIPRRSYEKVHHWFSNQRQKMANVERAIKKPRTPQTPPRPSHTVTHIGGTGPADETRKTLLRAQASDSFVREDSSDMSDISVEDGARILLNFIASVRAAHGTPSP